MITVKTIQKELERLNRDSTIKVDIRQDIGVGGYHVIWSHGEICFKSSRETLAFLQGVRVGVLTSSFDAKAEVPSSDDLKEGGSSDDLKEGGF